MHSQKAVFNKTFTGKPAINEDDPFLLNMSIPSGSLYPDYTLTTYVYKNDKGDIRLHGFARYIKYIVVTNPDGTTTHEVKNVTNYYFDVKKK